VSNVYRILWKHQSGDELSTICYPTVTEAMRNAEEEMKIEHALKQPIGFEIVWAGSGHPIPDWYRQSCLGSGK